MIKDMTVGAPTKMIIGFGIPLLIGNLFQQLYNISDILIVGRLIGVEALAAVGASSPLFVTLLMIAFGFTGGLTVITAQRFGAQDDKGVKSSVVHSLIASVVLSLVITGVTLIYLHELLNLMNVPENIMQDAYRFMFVLGWGLVLIVSYNLLSGFIRALGDSKTPLYFLIFSSVLNIILNLLLIYYGQLGVIGSALGTVIAMAISVVLCLIYMERKYPLLRLHREDWKFSWDFMKEHLHVAIPMALQFSVIALGLMIIQSVCNSFGSDVIAALTSALRIEQLATQFLAALGLALATYTAQNYGAKKISRIRKGVFNCSLISLAISVVIAVTVRFGGEEMVGIFIEGGNDHIVEIARGYLNISTMFYFFLGQIFIFRNALQGMGQAFIPMLASVVELVMRSYAAVVLAHLMGYRGIFYASPIAWVGAAVVVSIGYWMTIHGLKKKLGSADVQWSFRREKADDEATQSLTAE